MCISSNTNFEYFLYFAEIFPICIVSLKILIALIVEQKKQNLCFPTFHKRSGMKGLGMFDFENLIVL